MPKIPLSWAYMFSDVTTPPPTGSQIRFNAGPPYTGVTKLWLKDLTVNNRDVHTLILRIVTGTGIYIQDLDDATRYVVFRTLGVPTSQVGGYTEVPVVWSESGLPLANQQVDVITAPTMGFDDVVTGVGTPGVHTQWLTPTRLGDAPPPTPGITGSGTPGSHTQWVTPTTLGDAPPPVPPPELPADVVTGTGIPGNLAQWVTASVLGDAPVHIEQPIAPGGPTAPSVPAESVYVSLDMAKLHLRITDVAHDADIQAKVDQAEAQIVDYLVAGRGRWADPTLPEPGTTGGLIIRDAVLRLLACLYEHRGDDDGVDDPSAKVWASITGSLARLRSPVIA